MYRATLDATACGNTNAFRNRRGATTFVATGLASLLAATPLLAQTASPVAPAGSAAQSAPKPAAKPNPPAAAAPSAAPALPPSPCAAATYRQFDFWIGEWNVVNPEGRPLGQSKIEAVAGNCALLESWTSTGGLFTGKSLNSYDRTDRRWHQHWVDAGGGRLVLAGGFSDGKMMLEGSQRDLPRPGETTIQRISWTPNSDGTIRQIWQSSTDGGKNWATVFDGKYIKRDALSAAPEAAKKEADKKPEATKKDAPKADAKAADPKKADAKK